MNAGVNANHSRQEEGMKKKREKKKGSEKERQRWGVGAAKVEREGRCELETCRRWRDQTRWWIMFINCETVTRKQKGSAP